MSPVSISPAQNLVNSLVAALRYRPRPAVGRLILLILMFLLAITLSACGTDTEDGDNTATASASAEQARQTAESYFQPDRILSVSAEGRQVDIEHQAVLFMESDDPAQPDLFMVPTYGSFIPTPFLIPDDLIATDGYMYHVYEEMLESARVIFAEDSNIETIVFHPMMPTNTMGVLALSELEVTPELAHSFDFSSETRIDQRVKELPNFEADTQALQQTLDSIAAG